jgi:type IV pilus secretin PilQ/predicted competence protein
MLPRVPERSPMRPRRSNAKPSARRGAARAATGLAILVSLFTAGAAMRAAGSAESTTAPVQLKSLSWRTDRATTSLVIEASAPVAFLTSQPDPLTVLVDLRNVSTATIANAIAPPASSAISKVGIEDARAADGTSVARVRLVMAKPATHHVRSARNMIFVDIEGRALAAPRPAAPAIPFPTPAPAAGPPVATRLRSVRLDATASSAQVVLRGDGRLVAAAVKEADDVPPRLVLDFVGVASSAPAMTRGASGPIERVRVATNSRSPLVTRVVVDLARRMPYRIDQDGDGGRELRISFDTTAADAADPAGGIDLMSALSATPPVPPAPAPLPIPQKPSRVEPLAYAPVAVATAPLTETPRAPSTATATRPSTPADIPAAANAPVASSRAPSAASATAPAPPPATSAPSERPPAAERASSGQPPAIPAAPSAPPATTAPVRQPPAGQPQPAPQPPSQTGVPAQRSGERQYTGFPVSFDFAGVDLRAVLRTFSEITGLNIVIDPAVNGSVDVQLRDVPWDQALDIILRANKLGYSIDGNIVRIAPLTVLAEEEMQRRKLADEQALAGTLQVVTRSLSYARAEDLAQLITRSVLTTRGSVQVDPRTNTLIITDLSSVLPTATDLIATLDKPQPQVEIEARIVQTTRNFARALGIQWGVTGRLAPELGNTTNLAFPNQGAVSGRIGGANGGFQGPPAQNDAAAPTAVSLGVAGANTAIGLSLGSVNGALNLDAALTALETSGKLRVLSSPKVSTQNNVEAEITQGTQIPIQTVANNTVTVTFKDAALTLKVTPQITASNTVIMKISVENASPNFGRSVNNIPPIDTQRANTQVLVNDGQTTVIGGVYTSRESQQSDRTPGVNRIPLLGWLFRRESTADESNELLIFITPRIIKP